MHTDHARKCSSSIRAHSGTPFMSCRVGILVQPPGPFPELPCNRLGHCHSDPLARVVHHHSLKGIVTYTGNATVCSRPPGAEEEVSTRIKAALIHVAQHKHIEVASLPVQAIPLSATGGHGLKKEQAKQLGWL